VPQMGGNGLFTTEDAESAEVRRAEAWDRPCRRQLSPAIN